MNFPAELDPGHARHDDIREDKVKPVSIVSKLDERGRGIGCQASLVTQFGERLSSKQPDLAVILDDQDARTVRLRIYAFFSWHWQRRIVRCFGEVEGKG